jgi:hypothetical protein
MTRVQNRDMTKSTLRANSVLQIEVIHLFSVQGKYLGPNDTLACLAREQVLGYLHSSLLDATQRMVHGNLFWIPPPYLPLQLAQYYRAAFVLTHILYLLLVMLLPEYSVLVNA